MADQIAHMELARAPRREVWFVGGAFVFTAILYRYAWIPDAWESVLQQMERTAGLPVADVEAWFSTWAAGDGQTFALIASDPLGLDEGWQLNQPAYRYGRAGYGWLAWLASLGQEQWVPYGLAIVGVVTVGATFMLAMRLRPRLGFRAWLIVFNPAVLIAFAGDTAEGLGVFALALAMAYGHWWASAALGVIRPSFLLALIGWCRSLMWGVLSAAVLSLLLILRFGFEPGQYGGILVLPFSGFFEVPSVQSVGLAIVAIATIGVGLRHRNWAWVASGLVVTCFSALIVGGAHNGWRAAGMLYVLWAFGPQYRGPVTGNTGSPESAPLIAR